MFGNNKKRKHKGNKMINLLSILLGFFVFFLMAVILEILENKLSETEDKTHHDNKKFSHYYISNNK